MEEEAPITSASPEPLLRPGRQQSRPNRLAALFGSRGPPALVRETAALQLEQRRADWAYSRPVVALDIAWNLAFATVAAAMLAATTRERPDTPVRIWIAGYALQCVVHVVLVWAEYRRRRGIGRWRAEQDGGGAASLEADDSGEDEGGAGVWQSHQSR